MVTYEFALTFNEPKSAASFSIKQVKSFQRNSIPYSKIVSFGGCEALKLLQSAKKMTDSLMYRAACIKYLHVTLRDDISLDSFIDEIMKDLAEQSGVQSISFHGKLNKDISMNEIAPEENPQFYNQQYLFLSPLGVDNMYGWTISGGSGENVNVFISDFGLNENSEIVIENISGRDDKDNHGTAVAGVIGAQNNQKLTIGSAYKSKLYYTGFADLDKVIAYAKAGDVVNISGSYMLNGIEYPFISYKENMTMVATLAEMGVTCCYSSGNSAHDLDNITDSNGKHFLDKNSADYEASDAICVGGYNGDITLSRNYAIGSLVDVFAQATNVPVLWGDGYSYQSGTSFSTPIISGLIAQIQSILLEQGRSPLTPAEVKKLISSNKNGVSSITSNKNDKAVMPDLKKALSSLSILSPDIYVDNYGISENEIMTAQKSVYDLFTDDSFSALKTGITVKDIATSTTIVNGMKPGISKSTLLQLLMKANKIISPDGSEMISNSGLNEDDGSWIFYNGAQTFTANGVIINNENNDFIGIGYQNKLYFSLSSRYQMSCILSVSSLTASTCDIKFGAVFPGLGSIWSNPMEKTLTIDDTSLNTTLNISITFNPSNNNFSPKFPGLYITGAKEIKVMSISCKQLQ